MKNKVCFCGISEHCGYQIETDMEQHDKVIYEQGYNKAIDDFASELENHSISADIGKGNTVKIEFVAPVTRIRDVAEQFKAGGIDGNERTDT